VVLRPGLSLALGGGRFFWGLIPVSRLPEIVKRLIAQPRQGGAPTGLFSSLRAMSADIPLRPLRSSDCIGDKGRRSLLSTQSNVLAHSRD
jgi:hypothetical protein